MGGGVSEGAHPCARGSTAALTGHNRQEEGAVLAAAGRTRHRNDGAPRGLPTLRHCHVRKIRPQLHNQRIVRHQRRPQRHSYRHQYAHMQYIPWAGLQLHGHR